MQPVHLSPLRRELRVRRPSRLSRPRGEPGREGSGLHSHRLATGRPKMNTLPEALRVRVRRGSGEWGRAYGWACGAGSRSLRGSAGFPPPRFVVKARGGESSPAFHRGAANAAFDSWRGRG
jgi:hypothetical protein